MKQRLLLIVPLPPPMHGSNLMNQYVTQCRRLYDRYDVRVLPLHYAQSVADIGSFKVRKFFLLFRYLIQLIKALLVFKPDTAYFVPAITGMSFYRDCLFAAALKQSGAKVVYHLHGKGISDKVRSNLMRSLYRWFFKEAFIIHLSPLLYEDIRSVASINQCHFLPNGIHMEPLGLDEVESKSENTPFVFLFLSNLVPTKGPLILLEACQQLAAKEMPFKVRFVGNPSPDLEIDTFKGKISEMGIENQVEYLGPLYGSDKTNVLNDSDVFVFPTYYPRECFPLVLLEAMAAGLPLISTREGAIPEIIDDGVTGFMVEKENPKALAEKMEYLLNTPEHAKTMGEAGKDKFRKQYTIEKFQQNFITILDEITIDGKSKRSFQ